MSYFLYMLEDSGSFLSFSVWLSSFPNTIYQRYFPFPILHSWLFWSWINWPCIYWLIICSLFHCIDICVWFYANTILLWLLVWNQGAWQLQFCSSFPRLFVYLGVFCGYIENFRLFVNFKLGEEKIYKDRFLVFLYLL